jgi:hypothetical protein
MRQENWKGYTSTPFQQFKNTQDLLYTRQWLYQLCLNVKCDPIKTYKRILTSDEINEKDCGLYAFGILKGMNILYESYKFSLPLHSLIFT